MNVLLIHPPSSGDFPQHPLGIAYIAAYLDKCGHQVKLIDMAALGLNFRTLEKEIKKFGPKVAGISFLTPQYNQAMRCFSVIKHISPNIITVAGCADANW